MIKNTTFINNQAQERTKNIFVGFAEVNITNSRFSSDAVANPEAAAESDQTMGAFIFIILDVKMRVKGSSFTNGVSQYGGAIYVSGKSDLSVESSTFKSNTANVYGGAIYANGFKSVKVSGNSVF